MRMNMERFYQDIEGAYKDKERKVSCEDMDEVVNFIHLQAGFTNTVTSIWNYIYKWSWKRTAKQQEIYNQRICKRCPEFCFVADLTVMRQDSSRASDIVILDTRNDVDLKAGLTDSLSQVAHKCFSWDR